MPDTAAAVRRARRVPSGAVAAELAGEPAWLLPERAVFLPGDGVLLAADVHVGKSATLRAAGIPVPAGPTPGDLDRLAGLAERLDAKRVVVLGDFVHAAAGLDEPTLRAVGRFRGRLGPVSVEIVVGNHDRSAGPMPPFLARLYLPGPIRWRGLTLVHDPAEAEASDFFVAGHLHPAATLRGAGRQQLKLPCFWLTEHGLVVPAFSRFTGGVPVRPSRRDAVFVVADDRVVRVGDPGAYLPSSPSAP